MAIGTLPPELFAEQQQLNRQQQMAQLLMQQGQQMPQGQMVSGRFVAPSFFQNLAPLVQSYLGTKLAEKGDKQALELAKKLRQGQGEALADYMGELQGRPAIPERVTEMAGPYGQGVGDGGINVPMPTATIPARPAIEKNPLLANLNVLQNPYAPDFIKQYAMTQLTKGPKYKEFTQYNEKTGNTETYRYDEHSPDPRSTLQFIGISKPAFSPETQARFADEGISIPSQFRGGAVPAGQPSMQPMGQPTGQPAGQPSMGGKPQPTVPEKSKNNVIDRFGYDVFQGPPPPANTPAKELRAIRAEQSKPLTGTQATTVSGATNYLDSLNKYQNYIDTLKPADLLDLQVRRNLLSLHSQVKLTGKEANNLGVLNGGDEKILDAVMPNYSDITVTRQTLNDILVGQKEFGSGVIVSQYRTAEKAVPERLRKYVDIDIKPRTEKPVDKSDTSVRTPKAMFNNQVIVVKNGQWVYEKTGKPAQ
jgi:hypothetical protein